MIKRNSCIRPISKNYEWDKIWDVNLKSTMIMIYLFFVLYTIKIFVSCHSMTGLLWFMIQHNRFQLISPGGYLHVWLWLYYKWYLKCYSLKKEKREFLNDALEIHSSCLPKDIGIISHVIIILTMKLEWFYWHNISRCICNISIKGLQLFQNMYSYELYFVRTCR